MQGKNVHQKSKHVKLVVVSKLPQSVIDKYVRVILCCNLMHINGLAFLNTVSRGILFGNGSLIKKRTIEIIESGIKKVDTLYLQPGLKKIRLHSDGEFEPLQPKVTPLGINPNNASKKEYVT